LYFAILNDFANPEKVAEYFAKYDIKYSVQSHNDVKNGNAVEYTNAII
jgi:hypothetical protein